MQQLDSNITLVKKVSRDWAKKFKDAQQAQLKSFEAQIKQLYDQNLSSVFSTQEIDELKILEATR